MTDEVKLYTSVISPISTTVPAIKKPITDEVKLYTPVISSSYKVNITSDT